MHRRPAIELYLLRHGIAADRSTTGRDTDRALTDEGIQTMTAAARGMQRIGIKLDYMFSSPLIRAAQTAEIAGKALHTKPIIDDFLAPGCDLPALKKLLEQATHANRVMIVGHEPDFSQLIAALTGGGQVALKKGGLALVELPNDEDMDGILRWLLAPKLLRTLGGSSEL